MGFISNGAPAGLLTPLAIATSTMEVAWASDAVKEGLSRLVANARLTRNRREGSSGLNQHGIDVVACFRVQNTALDPARSQGDGVARVASDATGDFRLTGEPLDHCRREGQVAVLIEVDYLLEPLRPGFTLCRRHWAQLAFVEQGRRHGGQWLVFGPGKCWCCGLSFVSGFCSREALRVSGKELGGWGHLYLLDG